MALSVAGSFLLLYTLAFVPPPTAWLLELPELPVYLLLALGLFWSVGAACCRQSTRSAHACFASARACTICAVPAGRPTGWRCCWRPVCC
ncbi:MAG: hypothetical protein U0Z44_01595 [Kouleothrix sp.]